MARRERVADPCPGTWEWYVEAARQREAERYAGELTERWRAATEGTQQR